MVRKIAAKISTSWGEQTNTNIDINRKIIINDFSEKSYI